MSLSRRGTLLLIASLLIAGAIGIASLDANGVFYLPTQIIIIVGGIFGGVLIPLFTEIFRPAAFESKEHHRDSRHGKNASANQGLGKKNLVDRAIASWRGVAVYVGVVFLFAFETYELFTSPDFYGNKTIAVLVLLNLAIIPIFTIVRFISKSRDQSIDSSDSGTAQTEMGASLYESIQFNQALTDAARALSAPDPSSRFAALHALRELGTFSDKEAQACKDVLQAFIRQRGAKTETVEPSRREELELAISSWLALTPTTGVLNLSGLALDRLRLTDLSFVGANFEGVSMVEADVSGSNFAGANLSRALLTRCMGIGCSFKLAILNNADLAGAVLPEADFSGAAMDRANLNQIIAPGASFSEALLVNAYLNGADLQFVNFQNAMLLNVELTGTLMRGVKVGGAAVSEAIASELDNAIDSDFSNMELPVDEIFHALELSTAASNKVNVVRNDNDLNKWLQRRFSGPDE